MKMKRLLLAVLLLTAYMANGWACTNFIVGKKLRPTVPSSFLTLPILTVCSAICAISRCTACSGHHARHLRLGFGQIPR